MCFDCERDCNTDHGVPDSFDFLSLSEGGPTATAPRHQVDGTDSNLVEQADKKRVDMAVRYGDGFPGLLEAILVS